MNWNNSIKNLDLKLVASLGPEMGFLSFFIGILWPDDAVDPWDVVRERTEKLINQKIENEVYSRLKQTIAGLGGGSKHRLSVLGLYTDTLHEHIAPSKRYTQFQIANAQFVHDMPQFQEERHERVLLPLFMQCANMHLVLMNHALKLDSEILGLEPDDRLEIQKNLDASIDDYTIYAKKNHCDRATHRGRRPYDAIPAKYDDRCRRLLDAVAVPEVRQQEATRHAASEGGLFSEVRRPKCGFTQQRTSGRRVLSKTAQ